MRGPGVLLRLCSPFSESGARDRGGAAITADPLPVEVAWRLLLTAAAFRRLAEVPSSKP